jgi:hypothetical protein
LSVTNILMSPRTKNQSLAIVADREF